jgi:hypothetical protein
MNIKAENNYRQKTLFLFINTCYGRQHAKILALKLSRLSRRISVEMGKEMFLEHDFFLFCFRYLPVMFQ